MNSKVIMILAVVCFVVAAAMFGIGSSNSRLTELKDFFWVPLPLGVALMLWAKKCCASSCASKTPEPPKSV